MNITLDCADALTWLKGLPSGYAQTAITSPPYFNLRDYKIPNQIGLEKTPEEYVNRLVEVFREMRRVLRDDGTFWLNIGDSYNGIGGPGKQNGGPIGPTSAIAVEGTKGRRISGLKGKDLIGIPWMVAFALRGDGWYLRSDIIWEKPNCMPESVKDRPTRSHEYVFLLTKNQRYYYDADAIREPHMTGNRLDKWEGRTYGGKGPAKDDGRQCGNVRAYILNPNGRNKRSVWKISTKPYPEAHFATFPPKLVEPFILAGTSEKGCCSKCYAPWTRLTGRPCKQCSEFISTQGKSCEKCGYVNDWKAEREVSNEYGTTDWSTPGKATPRKLTDNGKQAGVGSSKTIAYGWKPSCECGQEPIPCRVIDPFMGAGTVGLVCKQLGRDFAGTDLNPDYVQLAKKRINEAP